MAKVAVLVPYQDMCEMARPLVGHWPEINPMCVEYTRTDQIRARVLELAEQGCELIIARGLQARIVRKATRIPVVEIRVTTQELGMLFLDLKKQLRLDCPRLGLIGFTNMFGDTGHYNELFHVDLRCYRVTDSEELLAAVDQAKKDGCDGIIGGETVCQAAKRKKIPAQFLSAGEESVRNALETAARVCYAIDLEKRNSAEMDTMLNNSFSGMIQVDRNGLVRRINRPGYELLGEPPLRIIGRPIAEILPDLDPAELHNAFSGGSDSYAFVTEIRKKTVLVNVAAISTDHSNQGAIFYLQEGQRITEMDSKLRLELYQRGYIARQTFDRVISDSPDMKEVLSLAKRVARYATPVILTGEAGSGKAMLAQCIHNESLRKKNGFVSLDCSAWQPDTLDTMLFGTYSSRRDSSTSMAEQARGGTLYLSHVEALPLETQYKVLNLILGLFLHNGPNLPEDTNVRVIASTDVNLMARVEKGEFRRDLYYAMHIVSIALPPLRQRKEDIAGWFDRYLGEYQERYNRHVHPTQGVYEFIQKYDWPGNLDQMSNLCERIVLLAERRSIDEGFLQKQLALVTPKLLPGTETVVVYKDPKADELAQLLRTHGGNREKVAAALGVSKTTLWRYMKKYGIEKDFSC